MELMDRLEVGDSADIDLCSATHAEKGRSIVQGRAKNVFARPFSVKSAGPRPMNADATPPSTHRVTRLLTAWHEGDAAATDELMTAVYEELRRIAYGYLRRERDGHTLQPTALVHEAYLRLVDDKQVNWHSRAHFYGIAARVMRRILVDHARTHAAAKRGAGVEALPLEALGENCRAGRGGLRRARQRAPEPRADRPTPE